MSDRTKAMDNLIAQDADLIDVPSGVTEADREVLIRISNSDDETSQRIRRGLIYTWEVGEIARHRQQAIEAQAAEIERLIKASDGDVGLMHWQGEKIERLEAEIERLRELIKVTGDHWLALQHKHPIQWEGAIDGAMAAACAEIERLREAGNDLGFYAAHEDACDCVKGWAKGPCNCGYTEAWQAWHSLAGKAE